MNEKLSSKLLYDSDLNQFPDLETYLKDLDYLRNTNFDSLDYEQIYNIFFDKATVLPLNYAWFTKEKFNAIKFYRVRLDVDVNKEDISLIDTYSHPASIFCKENGRANLKGKTVFYCSDNPNAALYESKPKIGSEGYLSVWTPNTDRDVNFGVYLPYNLKPNNLWHIVAKETYEYIFNHYYANSKVKFDHFIALTNLISELFVSETKPYSLTSMISNENLYGLNNTWQDFILYPSISSALNYCNMAFHPNSVNEMLRFEKVINFRVKDIKPEGITFNLGKVGYIQGSKMKWRVKNDEDVKYFKK